MTRQATGFGSPLGFGYSGATSGAAFDFWREEFCRRVMEVDLMPIGPGEVRCDITPTQLPQIRMSCSTGTAMKFISMGANNDLVLLMAPNSPLHAFMGQRALDIPPLGISLGDAAVKGAYVSQLQECGFKTALIDRKMLLSYCPDAEDKVARPLTQNPAVASLLHHNYDVVVRHAPRLALDAQNAIAQHLIDLVVLSIGARPDATEMAKNRGLQAARLEAVKSSILGRVGHGDLSLDDVAGRHRASPRAVQMLFENAGERFSAFLLEQRLLQAARLLQNTHYRARKIADIARLAGFNDPSYFHRAFRRRFHMTPADMREAARRATDASNDNGHRTEDGWRYAQAACAGAMRRDASCSLLVQVMISK